MNKYKIWDTLWYMKNNKATNSTVENISRCDPRKDRIIYYWLKQEYMWWYEWYNSIREEEVFPSKERLLASL